MDKNSTLETEAEVKNGIKRLVFAGVAIIGFFSQPAA